MSAAVGDAVAAVGEAVVDFAAGVGARLVGAGVIFAVGVDESCC